MAAQPEAGVAQPGVPQPARVPIDDASSSNPCRSSCSVSRANFARSGWPGGTNASLRCSTGGLALVP